MAMKYAGENAVRCLKTKLVALINAAKSAADTAQSTADSAASAAATAQRTANSAVTAANENTTAISTEKERAEKAEKANAAAITALADHVDAANAGAHNAIYRGKYLGTSVTSAQYAAIAAGTFDGLYIGDYWTIGGVNWRIAAFDYYLGTGDTACTTHHAVIVPDTLLASGRMNDTASTDKGYVGSEMYKSTLQTARTTITNAFGLEHVLTIRQYLCNGVTNGVPSSYGWYDSRLRLMTAQNIYGNLMCCAQEDTIDCTIFPLYAFTRYNYASVMWLRNIVSAKAYARATRDGFVDDGTATWGAAIRPSFCICG